jgi:hypothetical protein
MILKFYYRDDKITLEKYRLQDITDDKRCMFIPIVNIIDKQYRIEDNVYIVCSETMFKLTKLFNKETIPISAMVLYRNGIKIVFIPNNMLVFWNDKSIEPKEYNFLNGKSINEIFNLLKV